MLKKSCWWLLVLFFVGVIQFNAALGAGDDVVTLESGDRGPIFSVSMVNGEAHALLIGYQLGGDTRCRERLSDGTWGPESGGVHWQMGGAGHGGEVFYNVGAWAGLPAMASREYTRNLWGCQAGAVEAALLRAPEGSRRLTFGEAVPLFTNFSARSRA